MCGLVFKLQTDPYVGHLSFIRVYSGELKIGERVLNSCKHKTEKISKLVKLHANKREEVSSITTGDIGAIGGLKFTRTGDTLCDIDDFICLEAIEFPEPVIGIAIEPKTKADESGLFEALEKVALGTRASRFLAVKKQAKQLYQGWESCISILLLIDLSESSRYRRISGSSSRLPGGCYKIWPR